MLCFGIGFTPQQASAQGSVSFQVFYDDLSPYGTWVNSPQYGYVWMPNVSAGFTPYSTNGYWTFTDEGWTWVSNYPWGWAPFHYGRWYNDVTYGPMWVPGNEWGPGWVSWRSSGSYYGWAPMGPGVSIDMAYGSGYYDTYNQYTFVRSGNMGRTNINNYYVNTSNNTTIIKNTTVINNMRVNKTSNVSYSAGPDKKEVEKFTGKAFSPITIRESSKPGQSVTNKELHIYRPAVQKDVTSGAKPAPAKVADMKDVKTVSQRKGEAPTQKTNQPANQKPLQTQPNNSPRKAEEQRQPQQTKPTINMDGEKQQQHKSQPVEPQHQQPLRNSLPPVREQQTKPQQMQEGKPQPRNVPPAEQKQMQPNREPQRVQPTQPQQNNKPQNMQEERQQQPQQQREQPRQAQPQNEQPRQQQMQPQRANPPQNSGGENQQQRPQQQREQPHQQQAQPPQQREQPRQPQQQREQPRQQQTQPQRNQPQNMNEGKRPH